MSEGFGLDWLRLREASDMRARSRTLARGFGAAVRRKAGDAPALLVDLGAGSGAGFRALAPLIPGDQEWRLVDHDAALLGHQAAEIAQWARGQGYRVTHGNGVVTVDTGSAHWRAHSVDRDLAAGLDALSLGSAQGVACAALLDLVSEPWLRALAARLASARVPFLAALSVDGRREWRPEHAEDARVAAAFARHQRGDKGFGAALGPDAPGAARAIFSERGYGVNAAPADWRLDARDDALVAALIDGDAEAASASDPAAAAEIAAWRADRHAARAAGTLRLTVGHVDILAVADESP
jgi:hypothetical protein